jgi:hypothetical protein
MTADPASVLRQFQACVSSLEAELRVLQGASAGVAAGGEEALELELALALGKHAVRPEFSAVAALW